MDIQETIDNCRLTLDHPLHDDYLIEFEAKVQELKETDLDAYLDLSLDIGTRVEVIEKRLPEVTEEEFDEYTHLVALMGVIYA